MRDIKFRGLKLDDGKWMFGSLFIREQNAYGKPGFLICHFGGYCELVNPKTIGQYTGLKDKNGVEIYEGDIVVHKGRIKRKCVVVWDGDRWVTEFDLGGDWKKEVKKYSMRKTHQYEIVGNIYQNPELLED